MSMSQAYTVLYDSSGVEIGTATNPMRVDPTGTTPQPVSGTVTADQGTAAALAGAWPVELTDGTNTPAILNTAPAGTEYALAVRQVGTLTVTQARPSTGTVTSSSVTNTVSTVLASNANRLGALFFHAPGAASPAIYLKFAAAATTSSYSVQLTAQSEIELDFPTYTGIVTAITAAGTATLLVTEFT